MNFRDLMSRFSVPCVGEGEHEHARAGWLNVDCPYCSPGIRHFRLGFNLSRHYFSCWACGWHPLYATLSRLCGISIQETSNLVGAGFGSPDRVAPRPGGRLEVPKGVGELLPQHRRYLWSRGLDPDELVSIWRIGGIGLASKLQWRIYIPAFVGEEQVSWTTRSISDNGLRYISAGAMQESVPLKHILYGAEHAKSAIIICEGPIDAWKIGPGAVATCGLGYSQKQFALMAQYPLRIICFDNEPAAQKRARTVLKNLSVFDGDTMNVVVSAKDAADSSPDVIRNLREMIR